MVRNAGSAPITIRHLIVPQDARATRAVGVVDDQVLWWRTCPLCIPPGGFGEVRIKLMRSELSLAHCSLAGDGYALAVDLPTDPDALRILAVRFDRVDHHCCIYWRADGASPTVPAVYLDGQVAAALPAPTPQPGQIECLAVPQLQPPMLGAVLAVSLRAGAAGQDALIHVPERFQILSEADGTPLAGGPPRWLPVDDARWLPAAGAASVWWLRGCLTHGAGPNQDRGWSAATRQEAAWRASPAQLTAIHICSYRQEEGVAWFGHLCDIARTNPFQFSEDLSASRELKESARLADLCFQGITPDAWICSVPMDAASDDQVRARMLLAAASGCAGIHLRMRDEHAPNEIERSAMQRAAQILVPLLPLWDGSCPLACLDTDQPTVQARLVQLGRRRAAVVVLDTAASPRLQAVGLNVPLPDGCLLQRIISSTGTTLAEFTQPRPRCSLTMPHFKDCDVLFLQLTDPAPATAPTALLGAHP